MISVLIATKNRPWEIIPCVRSILRNSYQKFEIIIIDQNDDDITQNNLRALKDNRIISIRSRNGGKSAGLNTGIARSRGNIVAFTDDDCVVTPQWLYEIHRMFRIHNDIAAVSGRTLPYQPRRHPGLICPSITDRAVPKRITVPNHHARYIGFGNNMAFRKNFFSRYGGFKTWLGPGTVAASAEDAEILLRVPIVGSSIFYNPKAVVYHDSWLTTKQASQRELAYLRGEMACYTYWRTRGYTFASRVVTANVFRNPENIIKKYNGDTRVSVIFELKVLATTILGWMIGWCAAKTDAHTTKSRISRGKIKPTALLR